MLSEAQMIEEIKASFLDTKQVQEYVKKNYGRTWSHNYLYILIKEGRLKSTKVFNCRLFKKVDVDQLAAGMKRRAPNCVYHKEQ